MYVKGVNYVIKNPGYFNTTGPPELAHMCVNGTCGRTTSLFELVHTGANGASSGTIGPAERAHASAYGTYDGTTGPAELAPRWREWYLRWYDRA